MEQRLSIITLGVADLERATDFYESKFGWEKSNFSNENISFFVLNGIQFALFEKSELAKDALISSEGNGFNAFTIAYNTRSKNEVDELIASLKTKGVKIIKHPEETSWGGYSSYIADLDDNLWEIAFNPHLEIDKEGNIK
jgi:predicted lactoylglutathione lyase